MHYFKQAASCIFLLLSDGYTERHPLRHIHNNNSHNPHPYSRKSPRNPTQYQQLSHGTREIETFTSLYSYLIPELIYPRFTFETKKKDCEKYPYMEEYMRQSVTLNS